LIYLYSSLFYFLWRIITHTSVTRAYA